MNQTDLAEIFEVTPRFIRKLDAEGIPSVSAHTGTERVYDLRRVVPWWFHRELDRAKPDESALDRAKLEKERLEVRRRQIEIAQLEGDLVEVDEHIGIVTDLATRIRSTLLALPGAWGPRIIGILTPAQGTEAMRTLVDDMIDELARIADDIDGTSRRQPLPGDFPGYRHLTAADITSLEHLDRIDDLTSIRGIGKATAQRILLRLQKNAA